MRSRGEIGGPRDRFVLPQRRRRVRKRGVGAIARTGPRAHTERGPSAACGSDSADVSDKVSDDRAEYVGTSLDYYGRLPQVPQDSAAALHRAVGP
jgi:hypothetical protein